MSEADAVTIVIDAANADAGIVRELVAVIEQFPGEAEVLVELQTSHGAFNMLLTRQLVDPSPALYAAIRALGLVAVPGRLS